MAESRASAGWFPGDPGEVDVEAFEAECDIPASQQADLDACWNTQRPEPRHLFDLPTELYENQPPLQILSDSEEDEPMEGQTEDAEEAAAPSQEPLNISDDAAASTAAVPGLATCPAEHSRAEHAGASVVGQNPGVEPGMETDVMSPVPHTQQPMTQLPSPVNAPTEQRSDAQGSPSEFQKPPVLEEATTLDGHPVSSSPAVSPSPSLALDPKPARADSPLPSDVDSPRRIGRRPEAEQREWSPGIVFGDGPVSLQPCTQAPDMAGEHHSPSLHLNEFDTPSQGLRSPSLATQTSKQAVEALSPLPEPTDGETPSRQAGTGIGSGEADGPDEHPVLGPGRQSLATASPAGALDSAPGSLADPVTSSTSDRDVSGSASSADQFVVLPVTRELSSRPESAELPGEATSELDAAHDDNTIQAARKRPMATSPREETSSENEGRPVVLKRRRVGWIQRTAVLPHRPPNDVLLDSDANNTHSSKSGLCDGSHSVEELQAQAADRAKCPASDSTAAWTGCPSFLDIRNQRSVSWSSGQQVRSNIKTGMDLVRWRWGLKKN